MCSEVLARYLSDETGMTLEAVQKLIDYDPDLSDSDFNQLITPQQARDLKKALSSLKVLDPAVGSGAFPLGMMQVIAYPSIILVNKVKPDNHSARVLNWEMGQSVDEFALVFKKSSFLILQKELTADGWRLESPAVLRLLDKLRAAGTPLGEYVNRRFYFGILTGFNEAFIIDKSTHDQLIIEHQSSSDLLKPLVRGRNIKRWSIYFEEQYLIKIESSENKEHCWSGQPLDIAEKKFCQTYPAIWAYLNKVRLNLINRDIRNQGKYFWELRSCAYWHEFKYTKIIVPTITKNVQYALDTFGYFSNDKTSICIAEYPHYLLGVLNSKILWFWVQNIFPSKQNGFYEFKPTYVSKLPIPTASEPDRQAIASLVQKCLDAKGVGVEEWEAEIDDRVAHLYGLTNEEMKIIRGE